MKLYRYMPLHQFIEIVELHQLSFVSPSLWPDKFEGYAYSLLNTAKGKTILLESLTQKQISEPEKIVEKMSELSNYLYHQTFSICFTENADSVVMWNAYDYNNQAIMVEVNPDILYNLKIKTSGKRKYAPSIRILPINYFPDDKLPDFFAKYKTHNYGVEMDNDFEPLSIKRDYFSYEKEHRVLLSNSFCECERNENLDIKSIQLQIPNKLFPYFITDVKIHPEAKNEYVSIIEGLCKKLNIPCSGKSKVNDLSSQFLITSLN